MDNPPVVILSADALFADMLVRELALEGITAVASADAAAANAVADLDSGFSGERALLTFSRSAELSPDLVRPFEISAFTDLLRARMKPPSPGLTAPEAGADEELELTAGGARIGEREISLSDTERKLLALLASKPGVPFSRETIRAAVWGGDTGADSNICEVYIRYLREKLETGDSPRRIITVRGKGYLLKP